MREPFTRLYVHLVWATWDRLPLIDGELAVRLHKCIRAKAVDLGAEVTAIGGTEDHIHVLVRIPTTLRVSSLVQQIKGASSHLITHLPNAPDVFKWQGGYGAFTVSAWDLRRIEAYIERQCEHHEAGTLSANLERIDGS